MDIRKNKSPFPENIKRFALKATASAIIALNAESVAADSCPISIRGTALEGVVCDFDATSSVTVENGGEVGGINMAVTPGPPSFIAIKAGGLVNNTTGIGININSSSLSNGISNEGTITTASLGVGIDHGSTVRGGISNSGVISSTSGTSIFIGNGSTVHGDISNSGTIQASNTIDGIVLTNNSIIDGDITNSRLIEAVKGDGILLRSNSIIKNISNSGTISSVSGTGISVLNSSTIQGSLSNNGLITGGLQGISIHNASTVDVNIVNNSTISGGQDGLSIFSATTISGSISNNGTISGGQNGLSIATSTTISGSISNNGTISGGQTGISITNNAIINGGISNVGISNSGIIQGAINAIYIDPGSNVSNIDILRQSAQIIGAVEAPNTTVNITRDAIFTSQGTYNVNNFNIASNALFNMANTITALTVTNGGTLAITNTPQTIAGDYTQQTGGLFQTGVTNTSNYGQLLVTGAVDLLQNGDVYVQLSPTALLRSGDILFNVISGTTLTSPASGFNISDNSYLWRFIPTLNNTNNGLNLTVGINPDAYNVCQGTYCKGAATAIIGQVAAGNPTFSRYATLSTASAFSEAASQATPELTNENIQVTQLITRAVMDIAPMWGTLRGRSSGDALLYQPGKIWVKPYGASMAQNERNTVPGFNATAYGAVIGKDIQLSNDWLLGGGLAAGGDNMHGKAVLSGQSINSQAYQGMLYGAKRFPNHVYFAGQGLVGLGRNDTTRSIPLYASKAQGSFDSLFTNIRAETGWSTYALTPNFIFTPSVDASYLFINQKGYQEFGSPMDVLVASNNNSSLVFGAYTNGAYHLTNVHHQHDLTLTGYVGLAGDVLNGQPQVTSTFVASGTTFSTFGVQFNGVVLRGGAGLMLTNPTSPLTVELNYDLQAGNNAYSNVGAATIKYKT